MMARDRLARRADRGARARRRRRAPTPRPTTGRATRRASSAPDGPARSTIPPATSATARARAMRWCWPPSTTTRETFAQLWSWTQANLEIRGDHLAAWRWRPQDNPHVLDHNNATDGDLLIAWGLAEAGRRWRAARLYRRGAANRAVAGAQRGLSHRLRAGAAARRRRVRRRRRAATGRSSISPTGCFRPSTRSPKSRRRSIGRGCAAAGSRCSTRRSSAPFGLPADWISLRDGVAPAQERPPVFGYELIRAPLYLAWGPPEAKPRLAALAQSLARRVRRRARGDRRREGGDYAEFRRPRLSRHRRARPLRRSIVRNFPKNFASIHADRYYSATLHMLSLTALRTRYPQC